MFYSSGAISLARKLAKDANAVRVPAVKWVRLYPAWCVIKWKGPLTCDGDVYSPKPGLWFWSVWVERCDGTNQLAQRHGASDTRAAAQGLAEAAWHELHLETFARLRASALTHAG